MSSSQHDWLGDAALHALGRLPEDETAALGEEIRRSPELREESRELRGVAELLDLVDVSNTDTPPSPPGDFPDRIVAAVAESRQDRRRTMRRRIAAVAAAAVIVAIALTAVLTTSQSQPDYVEFEVTADDVDGRYALEGNEVGTSITLEFEGLDEETLYWLWLTDASGQRNSAGTFVGDGGDGSVVVLQAGLPIEAAERIWVTDEVDDVLLDSELEERT